MHADATNKLFQFVSLFDNFEIMTIATTKKNQTKNVAPIPTVE